VRHLARRPVFRVQLGTVQDGAEGPQHVVGVVLGTDRGGEDQVVFLLCLAGCVALPLLKLPKLLEVPDG
jgi:hypothetical protein